jgi:hypothetical protein
VISLLIDNWWREYRSKIGVEPLFKRLAVRNQIAKNDSEAQGWVGGVEE